MNRPHVCIYHERQRIGPTSRRRGWLILVDRCACGKYRPVHPVTWDQYTWLRRLIRGSQQQRQLRAGSELLATVTTETGLVRKGAKTMFVDAMHEAAVKTLAAAGYTYHGGQLWKPPLGPSPQPLFKRVDELEAAILAAKVLLEPTNEATEDAWQVLDDAYHRGNGSSE